MYKKIATTAKYIKDIKNSEPKIGIILGSGLGLFVESIENKTIIPYADIPFFAETTVEGHEGQLILGSINGVEIAALQGRYHVYEGHSMENVVFPVRVLAALGVKSIVLTNACGGLNPNFITGDLIAISDHINLMGKNPLIGENVNELGPRFPDMTKAYSPRLRKLLTTSAQENNYKMHSGVYAGVLGPSYETPAEIQMLRVIGADMVGMSTVPESIAANHIGLEVCGISCVTNMAAGIEDVELKHEDVKEEALKAMELFTTILKTFINKISTSA